MNYLGRNRMSCAAGLRDYHSATRCVEGWVAREQLEKLHLDLDVDVLARSGPCATGRMTEVETVIFYPTLVYLRGTLVDVAASADPAAWQQPLDAALGGLRQAVRCLRRRPGICRSQRLEGQQW